MRHLLFLSLLTGCQTENALKGEKGANEPFDSGSTWQPPETGAQETGVLTEECNGVDDDGDGDVDEGFPDDDGNGRVDCLDDVCPTLEVGVAGTVEIDPECEGTPSVVVTDPWDAAIEWQYTSAGAGVIVMPAVGNLTDDNGDGRIDEDDTPDIAFTTWTSNTLVALHGDGSGEIFELPGFDGQGGVTIADVDADGEPEIVAIESGYTIAAVAGDGTIEWESKSFGMMSYPQTAVADLDGDGMPEVVADVGVVNGEDGSTVATLGGLSNSWRTPVLADIDQDGTQEIILADNVYDENGTLEWSNPGAGAGNFNAVADIDGDDGGEVFFVSGSTGYLHDDDGTLLTSFVIPGSNPGPPSIADFDGDGEVELAVPANTKISMFELDGTKVWSADMQDSSGLAGCSGYDVDGDGAYEVLFADEIAFRMYDGATGTVLYENTSHSSGTVWEYPVIADVDNDGSAEIVVADNTYGGSGWKGVTVFGHSGDGWPKSGTTWGTHDFAVTNLEPDGTVPSPPDPSWLVYNVFRARPAVDDPSSADLAVAITDVCVADCEYGPVSIAIQAWNEGGADVAAGVVVGIYKEMDTGAELVTTYVLPALAMGEVLDGVEIELTPVDAAQYGYTVVIDPDDEVGECDETNNDATWADSFCR